MNLLQAVRKLFGSGFSISRGFIPGHDGVDIPAKEGTPVYAAASGVVEYARDARVQGDKGASGWAMGGGNVVNINIGGDLATQYAHLQKMVVHEGQHIQKGQLIGYVGRTGGQTSSGAFGGPGSQFVGSHVHFGLWNHKLNKMVNPTSFLIEAASGAVGPKGPQGKDDTNSLGAWNNIVSFPIGHVITTADVDTMMQKLNDAGYFKDDPLFLGVGQTLTRGILMTAVGKQWDKSLQDDLQAKFAQAAVDAGTSFNIAQGFADFGSTIVKVATYGAALVLILVGLFIYNKGGEGYGTA